MGISTWWYRGSDLDTERTSNATPAATLTEVTVDGNKASQASDDNACSVYVAKGADVITWSIQTVNPAILPDLCSITGTLGPAQPGPDELTPGRERLESFVDAPAGKHGRAKETGHTWQLAREAVSASGRTQGAGPHDQAGAATPSSTRP